MTHPTIWLSAGEVSGDMYGAKLAEEILTQLPTAKLIGMGGQKMKEAGVHLIQDVTSVSTIGFLEPLKHLKKYLTAFKKIKHQLYINQPDIVIAIDFQGFNIKILEHAKKIGLKTAYFISPQEWQWGSDNGGKKVIQVTDILLAIFKQEYDFYKRLGGNVKFIGHPLLDIVSPTLTQQQFKEKFNLDTQKQWIAIFPGSRKQEVKHVYPHLLKAAQQLYAKTPTLHFLVSIAENNLADEIIAPLKKSKIPFTIIKNHSHDIINNCLLSLCSCGTITLEHAILGKPCITGYRLNAISYKVAFAIVGKKWKEKIGYIALPNIYLHQNVIPEFLQDHCTAENISKAAFSLINDKTTYQECQNQLKKVQEMLGDKGATQHAATLILDALKTPQI